MALGVVIALAVQSTMTELVAQPLFGDGLIAGYVSLFPFILVTVYVAPKVSYRVRDSLLWIFPPSGLMLLATCVWRATLLPHRDWPPRADERDEVTRPGELDEPAR